MRALICGAGIAGLTLAWHLERSGWHVELVERAPGFRDGGYMIDFYGPGFEVVQSMGLEAKLLEVRYPVDGLTYLDRQGRPTSSMTLPPTFRQVVSVLRGDLARVIGQEVRAPIAYGTSIAEITQSADAINVILTSGEHREVDLLIGADGAHSRVRELAFGPEERFIRYLGHQVAAYILTDAALSKRVGPQYQMLTVPGSMAGAYALSHDRVATLFLHRTPDPALPDDPGDALLQTYGKLGWILPDLLDRRPTASEIYYDQVTQVEMDRWSTGSVTLLGDACQAVSLFAGHGASMAMTAAWTLADELGKADLPAALTRYEQRMRPRITDVQRFGRRFVKWMAPASQARITVRDVIVRLSALPGIDRLFLNSLAPGSRSLRAS